MKKPVHFLWIIFRHQLHSCSWSCASSAFFGSIISLHWRYNTWRQQYIQCINSSRVSIMYTSMLLETVVSHTWTHIWDYVTQLLSYPLLSQEKKNDTDQSNASWNTGFTTECVRFKGPGRLVAVNSRYGPFSVRFEAIVGSLLALVDVDEEEDAYE